MEDSQIETITPVLDPRLIGELPRFFGGWAPMLRELLQNAYRAGATRVEVRLAEGGTSLTLTDDGRGLEHPGVLLAAGRTGWSQAVIEPAGLGAFSVLSPELVRAASFASRGWRVRLEPERVLRGEAAVVERAATADAAGSGLRVALELRQIRTQPALVADLVRARGRYPFEVALNGEALPRPEPVGRIEVRVPSGRALWVEPHHSFATDHHGWGYGAFFASRDLAVWEHQVIEGSAFSEALTRAANRSACPEIAQAMRRGHVYFEIDPASGVRPKLPDRNALIAGEALERAAGEIVEALAERALEVVRERTRDWPERIEGELDADLELSRGWPACLVPAALESLGWKPCPTRDYAGLHFFEGDGTECGLEEPVRWDRQAMPVRQEHVALSINLMLERGLGDRLATVAKDGADVEIEGLRHDLECPEADAPWVTLASRLRVADLELPWLLAPDGCPALVVVGDAGAALRATRTLDGLLEHAVYAAYGEGRLWEDDWIEADLEIDRARVRACLESQIARHFETPEIHALRERAERLRLAGEKLADAAWRLEPRSGDADLDMEASRLKEAARALERRFAEVRADLEREHGL